MTFSSDTGDRSSVMDVLAVKDHRIVFVESSEGGVSVLSEDCMVPVVAEE